MPRLTGMVPNLAAALDTIAWSEIGPALLAHSLDDGYNLLVGSTPAKPLFFTDYSHHPDELNFEFDSTAAGRYQIIHPTWVNLQRVLKLPDFSPESQDRACLELIREHGAIDLFVNGNLEAALTACAKEWASLPASTAGQHLQRYSDLEAAFQAAGGILA